MFRGFALTLLVLLLSPFAAGQLQNHPVPGGLLVQSLPQSREEPTPKVSFEGKRVLVLAGAQQWQAVVGIPLFHKTGTAQLQVVDGAGRHTTLDFTIQHKLYPEERLVITNKKMVNPDPAGLRRIKAERQTLKQVLAQWHEHELSNINMILPVIGRLSSPFGLRRYFNGEPRNPHSGLDIAAPIGTPIKASLDGRVANTGLYYFTGNTVVLDHGQGLFGLYCHMNAIQVQAGDNIKQGQVIGTVGKTGRVTGPHLHWTLYLNNTKIDPALFLAT